MNFSKINYSYDVNTDSLFVYVSDKYVYDESVELNANVIMDFDVDGIPRAIELLSASKLFKIDKSYFDNISMLKLDIFINEDIIKLNVNLAVKVHGKIINENIVGKCLNDLNAPNFNDGLAIA
ncbi:MAG: DUF2283 domain-containing protein [archaeon]|nr:DUF2283 domain-containing protein [archaeon]